MQLNYDLKVEKFWIPNDRYASQTALIAGRKYNRKLDRFEFPTEFITVLQLHTNASPEFDVVGTAILKSLGAAFLEWRGATNSSATAQLLPHQVTDSYHLREQGYGLNISEPGTGKTRSTVFATTQFPVLVVCPNVARAIWAQEFQAQGLTTQTLLAGSAKERKKLEETPDVVIVGFPLVHKFSRLASYGNRGLTDDEKAPGVLNNRFQTVICDEAHHIKDPDAKQTRAVWALMDEAECRFLATATPIHENPGDLWSLLRAMRADLFPSSVRFKERYMLEQIGFSGYPEFSGLKPNMEREYKLLLQAFTRFHTLQDVIPGMPDFTYSEIHCAMGAKQARAYRQMAEEFKYIIDSRRIYASSSLSQRIRLLQFAAALPQVEDGQVIALLEPSCKIEALLEWLEDHHQQVVVFAESRLLLNLAQEVLEREEYTVGLIAGGINDRARASAVTQFQSGELQIMLIQAASGSESLTLTAANTAIFLGRSDSAILGVQGEGRIRRLGQMAEHLRIIDIITDDTIELSKHEMLSEKNKVASNLVGG